MAQARCAEMGAYLVNINSNGETTALKKIFQSKYQWPGSLAYGVWIGLTYNQPSRAWVWSQANASSSVAYQNWVGGVQPNDTSYHKRCAKAMSGSYMWTSDYCHHVFVNYICEKGKAFKI